MRFSRYREQEIIKFEIGQLDLYKGESYIMNFGKLFWAYIDPEIIILRGSVALKLKGFVEEVESLVKDQVYDVMKPYVKVHKSTLNEDSGLLGAACLAFQKSQDQ